MFRKVLFSPNSFTRYQDCTIIVRQQLRCVSLSSVQLGQARAELLQLKKKKRDALLQSQLAKRVPTENNWGDDLPEHVYERANHKLGLQVHTWGVAAHGALGRASFLRPDSKKKQKRVEFKHYPHRVQLGDTHKVIDLSCGYGFTCFAVNSKGRPSLFGTGINQSGQIGYHTPREDHPLLTVAAPAPIRVPLDETERIVKVSCGRAHTLAVTNTGVAYTMGNNAFGQCGRRIIPDEDYTRQTIYTSLKQAIEEPVTQVVAGQDVSFFVTKTGAVYSCGWGADGQTGRGHYNNEATVGRVEGDLKGLAVTKLSCKADCAIALTESGDVFGWGNNEYRQLTLCGTSDTQVAMPLHLKLPASVGRVVDVAAGGTACYIVNDRGELYSWGYGILGLGPERLYADAPQLIPPTLLGRNVITPEAKVVSVACGVHIAACTTDNGHLFTWGKNIGGSLGQGHSDEQSFPIRVALQTHILHVSCGVDHMAVISRQQ